MDGEVGRRGRRSGIHLASIAAAPRHGQYRLRMLEFAERPWWPGDPQQFREALRYWIATNATPDITVRQWWHRLANAGLTAPTWPRVHGGLGATSRVQETVETELAAAGTLAPPVDHDGFRAVAPVLRQLLPPDQLARWLEPLLRGEHTWDLLVHEPGRAPDDIECRAVHDWKYTSVTGAKSQEAATTHALVVCRSDPAATGTSGLSCMMLDLTVDGVVRGGGSVRFAGLEVLNDRTLGQPGEGWSVVRLVRPYLDRSLAGRIRRGLVHVPAGHQIGALDLTMAEAHRTFGTTPVSPPVERRSR